MLYGMYASAAGALANSYQQDVVANNLANVDTVAFKKDLALLQGRPVEAAPSGSMRDATAVLESMGGGLFALPTHTDFTPASLKETGSNFDFALAGKGFFQLSDGSGKSYTRDGRFKLNELNQLVSFSGDIPVLDDSGKPMVLDPDRKFEVDSVGLITQDNDPVGRLGIVDFDDVGKLVKHGENLYRAESGAGEHSITADIKHKHLEDSGVNPITELVEMLKIQRLFQANVSMLQSQDQTLAIAVSKVGRVG